MACRDRPCGFCGEFETKEGHDHCLGRLSAVVNACCGHGVIAEAYVQFDDWSRLSENDAITFIDAQPPSEDFESNSGEPVRYANLRELLDAL